MKANLPMSHSDMKLHVTNDSKMKELILHVATASENDENFGAVKLNKILFYADFLSYLKRGVSITGQEYFALDEGPAPRRLVPIREQMKQKGEIAIKTVNRFGFPQNRIVALREPDYSKLDAEDIAIVNAIIERLRGKTGKEVTNDSHRFAGWIAAFSKGEKTTIPYSMVLFDPVGFFGFEPPAIPQSLVAYGKRLEKELKAA